MQEDMDTRHTRLRRDFVHASLTEWLGAGTKPNKTERRAQFQICGLGDTGYHLRSCLNMEGTGTPVTPENELNRVSEQRRIQGPTLVQSCCSLCRALESLGERAKGRGTQASPTESLDFPWLTGTSNNWIWRMFLPGLWQYFLMDSSLCKTVREKGCLGSAFILRKPQSWELKFLLFSRL